MQQARFSPSLSQTTVRAYYKAGSLSEPAKFAEITFNYYYFFLERKA